MDRLAKALTSIEDRRSIGVNSDARWALRGLVRIRKRNVEESGGALKGKAPGQARKGRCRQRSEREQKGKGR